MKAIDFQSQLNPDQTLTVPTSVRSAIPVGQMVRVLILIPESDTDREWEQQAAEEFGRGYADADAIYDQLLPRPGGRSGFSLTRSGFLSG
jgi:hypothetical protein